MVNIEKHQKLLTILLMVFTSATLAFVSYTSLALFLAQTADVGVYPGIVGLRSYFQRGTGTEADPFVISRPIHFNNLTRLQNLGVFSDKKYYFTLGYDPNRQNSTTGQDDTYDPYGTLHGQDKLQFYQDNSSSTMISYLDMSTAGKVMAIGSEGSPFYGTFDGNGKEVYGLNVQSGPEDVGVFGYTYTGSKLQDIYFNHLTITDNGYDSSITDLSTLYGESVEQPSVTYTAGGTGTTLQTDLTATAASFSDLSGSFAATLPTSYSDVTYEFRSSSEYFTKQSDGTIKINTGTDDETTGYYCIANNTNFTSTNGATLSSRLSVIAKVYYDDIVYSKALATYRVTFVNTLTNGVSSISMKAVKDYVNSALVTDNTYTEYAHGVNIGYLVGHCDGTMSNCYVFDGSLVMNSAASSETSIVKVPQETETGLIGEIGCSLDNEFSPQVAYDTTGDTGVVNFTKMYSDIRGTDVAGTYVNLHGGYYTFTPVAGTADKFLTYLRTDLNRTSPSYVTGAANSVDFKGRQVVADTKASTGVDAVNRNLGVFSLVTSDWDNTDSSTFYLGLNDYAISRDASETSDFYYTTAEWQDPTGTGETVDNWSQSLNATERILQPHRLPIYSDAFTWNSRLEKYFNFAFHCSLGSDSAISKDYFFNTDNAFLQNYFSYKLVSKTGTSVPVGSKNFGVFVKNVDLDAKTTTNIEQFDSSLKMSAPNLTGNSNDMIPTFTLSGDTTVYPTKTIDFSIKNANGANVTVIAASKSGSGSYVGIYDKSVSLASSFNVGGKYANRHPAYAMYLPYSTNNDDFCYYNYDYTTGATSTSATIGTRANKLFAHTFKLPAGDYFVASPFADSYVYYVCAQGQNQEGNTGNESSVFSTYNTISNVDFISKSPYKGNTSNDFVLADDRCWLAFKGKFTSASGTISVDSTHGDSTNTSVISTPANLTSILIYNRKNYNVTFNNSTTTETFIEYPVS